MYEYYVPLFSKERFVLIPKAISWSTFSAWTNPRRDWPRSGVQRILSIPVTPSTRSRTASFVPVLSIQCWADILVWLPSVWLRWPFSTDDLSPEWTQTSSGSLPRSLASRSVCTGQSSSDLEMKRRGNGMGPSERSVKIPGIENHASAKHEAIRFVIKFCFVSKGQLPSYLSADFSVFIRCYF